MYKIICEMLFVYRIQSMTKGCVGIWAKKIMGDYCRYLHDATNYLSRRLTRTTELIQS